MDLIHHSNSAAGWELAVGEEIKGKGCYTSWMGVQQGNLGMGNALVD